MCCSENIQEDVNDNKEFFIKERYCSYELAFLLDELGFEGDCHSYYKEELVNNEMVINHYLSLDIPKNDKNVLKCPTIWVAKQWVLHKFDIDVNYIQSSYSGDYLPTVDGGFVVMEEPCCNECAVEYGLIEVLKIALEETQNLIEMEFEDEGIEEKEDGSKVLKLKI